MHGEQVAEEQVAEIAPDESGPSPDERDWEAEARVDGWRPLDEWKKHPDSWKEAKDFVIAGESILPIVQARLRKEQRKTADFDARVQRLEAAHRKSTETLVARLKAQNEGLKKQQMTAVDEADGDTFRAVSEQLEDNEAQIETLQTAAQQEPQFTAEFIEWREKNDWFQTNQPLTAAAQVIANRLAKMYPQDSEDAFYARLDKEMAAEFPEKFGANPNRQRPGNSEAATGPTQSGGKHSFSDLPAEAKAAFKETKAMMESAGEKYTQTQFLEAYYEED